jgi:hypothetical protein
MYRRSTIRRKDGEKSRHFSVVERRRLTSGSVIQRRILSSGETNDNQETAWRKTWKCLMKAAGNLRHSLCFPRTASCLRTH